MATASTEIEKGAETQGVSEATGFWSRARVAFYSALVTQKHGELLDSEGTDSVDGETGDAKETANDAGPSEPQRIVGEEEEFSESMNDTWLQLLDEEITLLKVERQNELLAQNQDSPTGRSAPSQKRPAWVDLPPASPPPPIVCTNPHPPKSLSKVISVRTVRTGPPIPHPTAEELPRVHTQPLVLRKRGPLILSGPLVAAAPKTVQTGGVEKLDGEKLDGGESGLEDGLKRPSVGRRRRSKTGLPGGSELLEEEPPAKVPASVAQRRAQRAVLERKESGISAAAAAAEAAHVGGKRIRGMWSKMKTALGGRSKDKSGPRKPDMDALRLAVKAGELPADKRGAAWLALALQDAQDIVDAKHRYASFVAVKSEQDPEIRRDIHRTFPEHPLFEEDNGPGQKALYNVMKAYAAYDPEVGYCQGMAFLAAVLLMHVGEADAFAVLIHTTFRCGFRATFLPDMTQLQARLYQLTQLVTEALPELEAHMEGLGVTPVMYGASWFLTAFASTLPLPLVFRVIDVVLAERSSAMVFRTALVLLQVSFRQLLQCPEAEHLVHFVRRALPRQLGALAAADLEEIPAKALRVDLPFESMLRLEAEYELLAEEAATAANEIDAAAAASRAAAAAWEKSRSELEARLAFALQAQARAESQLAALRHRDQLELERSATDQAVANDSSARNGPGDLSSSDHVYAAAQPADLSTSRGGEPPNGRPSLEAPSSDGETDSEEDVRYVPSAVLLRKVGVLRHDKHVIDGQLKRAEDALQKAIRHENRRLASGKDGGVGGAFSHIRRASWAASLAKS